MTAVTCNRCRLDCHKAPTIVKVRLGEIYGNPVYCELAFCSTSCLNLWAGSEAASLITQAMEDIVSGKYNLRPDPVLAKRFGMKEE